MEYLFLYVVFMHHCLFYATAQNFLLFILTIKEDVVLFYLMRALGIIICLVLEPPTSKFKRSLSEVFLRLRGEE